MIIAKEMSTSKRVLTHVKTVAVQIANFSTKPTASEVLTAYLTQCKEPPWTSYFVKIGSRTFRTVREPVKEVAIVSQNHTQTFLVKPPYSFYCLKQEEKKQVQWLERNQGIFWSEGFIDFIEFQYVILPYLENVKIISKGLEKNKWIKELCANCEVIVIGKKGCNFST